MIGRRFAACGGREGSGGGSGSGSGGADDAGF